jgi:hypothetical protein
MDVSLRSGLFKGQRLMDFFRRHFADRPVEDLTMPFAAVAPRKQSRKVAPRWNESRTTLLC